MRNRRWDALLPLGIAGVILTFMPLGLSGYSRRLLIEMLIWAIYAMSFDLLLGYGGLISFGHSAFWGTGAYIVGIFISKGLTTNFWFILLSCITLSLVMGVLFGFVVMRTSEIYFTFVTLALSQALQVLSIKWTTLTGGIDGISGISRPFDFKGIGFYYFVLVFFVLSFLFMQWICRSKFGRVLIGIRENEYRMKALGYNIWTFKYVTYVISGVFGAVAGFLSAYHNRFVSYEDYSFIITGTALLMVLIGGKASQTGSFIGSIFVILLYRLISTYTEHWLLVVGIIFVIIVLFARQGFIGYSVELWRKIGYERIIHR